MSLVSSLKSRLGMTTRADRFDPADSLAAPFPISFGTTDAMVERYVPLTMFHVVSAHAVLADSTLMEFYRERSRAGAYIVVDGGENDFHEGTWSDLREAVGLVIAREVILPTSYADPQMARDAYSRIDEVLDWGVRVVVTPHAPIDPTVDLEQEWLTEYADVLTRSDNPNVVLGIPDYISLDEESIRLGVDSGRAHHLCGVQDSLARLAVWRAYPWLQSAHTNAPTLVALRGLEYEGTVGTPLGEPDYLPAEVDLPRSLVDVADWNHLSALRWASGWGG